METTPANPQNLYELMENDKGEMMALIFADDTAPQNPVFYLNETEKFIELHRTKDNIVYIEDLEPETVEKVKKITKLYVCEMEYNKEGENKIAYLYAAELKKNDPLQKNTPPQPSAAQTLSEKARKAREKILNKSSASAKDKK